MDTKGNVNLVIVIIILAAAVLLLLIMNYSARECSNNKDCSETAYCGSDFTCHEYPNTITVKNQNYAVPALILGLSLVAAAYIMKTKFPAFGKENKDKKE